MAYTDEFGNIFGEAEDFVDNADWENMFVNTPDNPWVAGNVFDYDWSNPTGTGMGLFKNYLNKFFSGQGSTADYGTAIAGLLGLYEQMNKDRSPKMWEGKVTKTPYTAPTTTPEFNTAVQQRPYGELMVATTPQTYTGGVPMAAPAPTKSIFAPRTAAAGGLMGMAQGGATDAPRYLRGETDGMEDKIPSNIDGVQPAKLSHGEFVIPADVVSHLGNGNSDAGAKQLYKMMDRVRQARTGTKKQGKQINPDKFLA